MATLRAQNLDPQQRSEIRNKFKDARQLYASYLHAGTCSERPTEARSRCNTELTQMVTTFQLAWSDFENTLSDEVRALSARVVAHDVAPPDYCVDLASFVYNEREVYEALVDTDLTAFAERYCVQSFDRRESVDRALTIAGIPGTSVVSGEATGRTVCDD
ncbi:MAG: hypothetical protein MJB57_11370 [Gemmatimonadetes bacterium]|nr:hypothetical protein [Gemmatimonadota bacterium]